MLNGLISPILTLQSYQASPIIQILTMYALNVSDLLLFGSEALCALYSGSLNANCIVSTVQYNQQLFYSTYIVTYYYIIDIVIDSSSDNKLHYITSFFENRSKI